jgi:hypothetical protein
VVLSTTAGRRGSDSGNRQTRSDRRSSWLDETLTPAFSKFEPSLSLTKTAMSTLGSPRTTPIHCPKLTLVGSPFSCNEILMTFRILDVTKVRRREKSSNPFTRSLVSLAPPTLLLNTRISIDVLGIELLFSRAERVGMAGIIRKRNLTQVKVRLLKLRKTKGLLLRTKMKRVGAPNSREERRPTRCKPPKADKSRRTVLTTVTIRIGTKPPAQALDGTE